MAEIKVINANEGCVTADELSPGTYGRIVAGTNSRDGLSVLKTRDALVLLDGDCFTGSGLSHIMVHPYPVGTEITITV